MTGTVELRRRGEGDGSVRLGRVARGIWYTVWRDLKGRNFKGLSYCISMLHDFTNDKSLTQRRVS